MAILEIRKSNDPVLRKKCENVTEINPKIKEIAADMAETMEKKQGVGLAAPQVGINKKIIVINPDPLQDKGVLCLVNPKIIKKSEEREIGEEGCLSFPGIFLKIKRAREINVEAQNIKGEPVKMKAEGLLARVLQHEIDHLDGILFFDRLPFWQRIKFTLLNNFKKWR